ncbi:hypothetical protein [Xenorhabdus sp. SGI246]|uniref:hypothetical protein n=1 Tax=Xenorhabdus sp. SGI246 TaxID=3158263 RepID=UPI00349F1E27
MVRPETKALYDNATVIELPKEVHQASRTYKGRNSPTQVASDSADLCGAECLDIKDRRTLLIQHGYNPKLVDDALELLKQRNREIGTIKK